MSFNKTVFWNMKRDHAKKKLLPHIDVPTNSGNHYYTVFFYNNTKQTDLLNMIEAVAQENGVIRSQVPLLMARTLGFEGVADYKRIQKGEKALEYWEATLLMKKFGIKFEITKPKKDDFYKFYFEGNRLVLEKKLIQPFKINFNIENWYDFEVDFSKAQTVIRALTYLKLDSEALCKKLFIEVIKIMNWYFLTQTGEKELPVDLFKIRALFQSKFVKNETRHKLMGVTDIKVD